MAELETRVVTITLTQQCNLACSYCYEHHKTQSAMDFSTAKSIIDQELLNTPDGESLEFDLFGGEPFLEFELIKAITEYICQNKGEKNCRVFATTNGTLVHGEIQEWLIQHKQCFICGLSLDGTREMHNLNRSNSYDMIDLSFFKEQYPNQEIKMTISPETLPHLAEDVIDVHKQGFLVACNLAYEINWSNPQNATILERELHTLIDFYLANPEIEPCSILEMGRYNVGYEKDQAVRFCGAGVYMRSYDVDGKSYPCQFFMPLSLGNDKAATAHKIKFPEDVIPLELLDEKCRECIIKSVCPNCFGANYAATGSIYSRDDNMCRLTKIIVRARSYFKARQWQLGQLHENENDQQALLRAIVAIQEGLNV